MPEKVPVRKRLEAARSFVQRGVWELDLSALGTLKAALLVRLRLMILLVEGTWRDQLLLRAAALTYKTVFSLVPLLAVMLAFFKGFGGTEKAGQELQKAALENATPGLANVMEQINGSISNIHAGAVGGIGIVLLLYTAISLLTTVEESFNHIWGVRQGRTFFWRCIIYWGVITLGPVVFMTSLAATTFVDSSSLMAWIRENGRGLNAGLLALMPFAFAWFGFAFLYYFMPNTRVQWRAAFAGGIIGGTLWEGAKHGYIWYNTHLVGGTYAIYGAIAAVPIFLLWIYLSWAIVLFGAEFAFAFQNVRTYRREIAVEPPSPAAQEELSLLALLFVAREYAAGRMPVTVRQIGEAFNVPVRFANDVFFRLGAAGLVREVTGPEPAYVPGRDTAAITVKEVLDAVVRAGSNPVLAGRGECAVVRGILERADGALQKELGDVTLAQLVRQAPDPGPVKRDERRS